MIALNIERLRESLARYAQYCEESGWVQGETYKFFFSNWLNQRVDLKSQTAHDVLSLCLQSMKEKYSGHDRGIQFIIRGARQKLSEPISLADTELFKQLSSQGDVTPIASYNRGMSYPVLTAWLGTLFPEKFVCVSSTEFTTSIKYLFNTEIPDRGLDFFWKSQEYFTTLKQALKDSDVPPYYLPQINKYLKLQFPDLPEKRKYDEADWNWATEDFALFIVRKVLDINVPRRRKRKEPRGDISINPALTNELAENEQIGTLDDLLRIDLKYRDAAPEVKEYISKRIERGSISERFKEFAGFKCMICDSMGENPYSFDKPNGKPYIEVHHVIPVSSLQTGSLSTANLITVCANHHRQLHYGVCELSGFDDNKIVFKLDDKTCVIKKLRWVGR